MPVSHFNTSTNTFLSIEFLIFCRKGIGPIANYLSDEVDENGDLVEPAHKTMNINLTACMNTVTLGIHQMKKQKNGGSIVMTASGSSYQRFPPADYSQHCPSVYFRPP
jgi:NAD(P)-dependent dehydrogenase (short-subunit alcohol dehydrogenase family)